MKASLLSSIIVALQAVLGLACVGCSQRPPVQTADIDFGALTPRPRRIEKYEQAESQRSEEPAAREKEASPLSKEPTPDATAAPEKAAEGSGGRAGDYRAASRCVGCLRDSGLLSASRAPRCECATDDLRPMQRVIARLRDT